MTPPLTLYTYVQILHHDASSDDVSLATTTPLDEVNCPYQWTQATDVVHPEPETLNAKPQTPNLNPKPQTLNPRP